VRLKKGGGVYFKLGSCSKPVFFLLSGKSSQWKGTVLDQVPVNPSLYLIKYDGFDCIYGLELYSDERVVGLEVLPDRVGESSPCYCHSSTWRAPEELQLKDLNYFFY